MVIEMDIDNLIGAEVKYINEDKVNPYFYPPVGTKGIVVDKGALNDSIKVKWEKGSTSDTDVWFCNLEDVEVVKYSETQINTSWIEKLGYGGWGDIYWECGSCHKEYSFKEGTPLQNDWHFCPKCGTKKANEIRIGENLEDESE